MGWTPVLAPVLEIEALPPIPFQACGAVIVTSGNALPAVLQFVERPLLAVGDATAARARAAGFRQVHSAGGDAAALAALVPGLVPPGASLLLPTAEDEGDALAAALRGAGFAVERRLAYRVRDAVVMPSAAGEALAAGTLRAALFLSARTARSFAALLDPLQRRLLAEVEALAIGQPAADHLTPLPWRRVRVPLTPSLDQVLALL